MPSHQREAMLEVLWKISSDQAGDASEKEMVKSFIDRLIDAKQLKKEAQISADPMIGRLNPMCADSLERIGAFLEVDTLAYVNSRIEKHGRWVAVGTLSAILLLAYDIRHRSPKKNIPERAY